MSLAPAPAADRPRVGFLGVGWIGRHRMQAMIEAGLVEAAAVADASAEAAAQACALAPGCEAVDGLDALLDRGLDAVVIATPSALHAEQAIRALRAGVAVFCQKPLGRTADEARAVVEAAEDADRLLQVDLSYRFTEAAQAIRRLVRQGDLGRVYAADLSFHNAYGPDKPWFYDPTLSGGGCVMDLGVHLVDLALWALDFPSVQTVRGRLYVRGEPLAGEAAVEDYATAELLLAGGVSVRLACSWNLPAGRDAAISAAFYGADGGAELTNVDGSFYDFEAWRCRGPKREPLAAPPDAWGGRAACAFAERLAAGARFDPEARRLVDVAEVLDRIYGR